MVAGWTVWTAVYSRCRWYIFWSAISVGRISCIISKPFSKYELCCAAAYGITLLWVNLYICRDFFFHETAYMNSMHGFWIALARLGGDSWFHPSWWPDWDR